MKESLRLLHWKPLPYCLRAVYFHQKVQNQFWWFAPPLFGACQRFHRALQFSFRTVGVAEALAHFAPIPLPRILLCGSRRPVARARSAHGRTFGRGALAPRLQRRRHRRRGNFRRRRWGVVIHGIPPCGLPDSLARGRGGTRPRVGTGFCCGRSPDPDSVSSRHQGLLALQVIPAMCPHFTNLTYHVGRVGASGASWLSRQANRRSTPFKSPRELDCSIA